MFKSTLFILITLITFTSCSEDSIVDPIVGEYTGGLLINSATLTGQTSVEETYEDVEVTELSGDRISINLGPQYENFIGDVSEDHEITMSSYSGTSASGIALELNSGVGQFSIDTVVGSGQKIKVLTLFFEDFDQNESAAMMQLVEKI